MLRALLTNIQALTKTPKTAGKAVTRELHFDKKWGENAAYKKNSEKPAYESVDHTQDQAAEIYEQILVMYKTTPRSKASSERGDFLSKMAVDSMDFIQEQRQALAQVKQEEQLCHESMAAMVEHIFEILKAYSYELNNALGFGPLHVAATNPQAVTEVVKFNTLRQAEETVTYTRARLSTPSFSLVLRGDKRGIYFFIIPVERAIGLSQQECHFLPVAKLAARFVDNQVVWETDNGRSLTPSMVELICMNLFQRLIEETKLLYRRSNQSHGDDELAC